VNTDSDIDSRSSHRGTPDFQPYVRVTNRERKGIVEFNFSIGDPTLFLEMILPVNAFEEFCQMNEVRFLTPEQEEAVDRNESIWNESVIADDADSIDDEQ
jgi:phenol hydroxylase P0 protein